MYEKLIITSYFVWYTYLINRTTLIAGCHISLNVVESPEFHNLMTIACPTFKVPTRQTVRDSIIRESEVVKEKVSYFLKFINATLNFMIYYYNIDLEDKAKNRA